LSITTLITSDFAAGAVLISFVVEIQQLRPILPSINESSRLRLL
jgi:hypothetical protein